MLVTFGAYPCGALFNTPRKIRLMVLTVTTRKISQGTYAPAYLDSASVMKEIGFITFTPGANVMKLIFPIIGEFL